MARFNFDVARETKRPKSNRGKVLRVVLLFCLVAAITAAVIYAVVPKSDPETPSGGNGTVSGGETVESVPNDGTDAGNGNAVDPESGSKTPANGGGNTPGNSTDLSSDDKNGGSSEGENGDTAGSSGNIGSDPGSGAAGAGGVPPAPHGGNAKYDPSAAELLKHTDEFRKMLNNGSWKKQPDVIIHTVASGDTLERLARKYNNTIQFLQKGNGIRGSVIRIGQKIHLLRADSWQIVISRKKAELQLNRIIGGNAVPMAVFPCRIRSGAPVSEMMVSSRLSRPYYVDHLGRKYAPGTQGNPYGEGLISLARASAPDAYLNISIHGQGDAPAVDRSVAAGGVALHNQDIVLLYLLVPEKTPVMIIE